MKSHRVRHLCCFSCQHCHWWNKSMASLTMHKVPLAAFDYRINLWRNIVIALRWPCLHANHTHPLDLSLPWQRVGATARLRSQQRHSHPVTCQASSNFMDVRLNPPHMGKVA